MPTHSEVRWNSNAKIVNAISTERINLIQVFEELMNNAHSNSNTVREAEAYANKLSEFDFVFYLLVFKDIFLKTELVYNVLQKNLIDIQICINHISICERALKDMRNEETFQKYIDEAKIVTEHSPKISRYNERNNITISCHYKSRFYEIIDNITTQISTRFSNIKYLKFLQLSNSAQFEIFQKTFPQDALDSLMTIYGDFFNINFFKNELMAIYANENKQLFHGNNIEIILKNIVENDLCDTLPQAYRLFSIIATIPATTVSVERSFSCLSRIKTFLRSTMGQERLSSLALASIEKELLAFLSTQANWHTKVINRFTKLKERRIDLIYKH